MCVCVCVCVCSRARAFKTPHSNIQTEPFNRKSSLHFCRSSLISAPFAKDNSFNGSSVPRASLLSRHVILGVEGWKLGLGRGGLNHPVIAAFRTEVCPADKSPVYIFTECVTARESAFIKTWRELRGLLGTGNDSCAFVLRWVFVSWMMCVSQVFHL